MERWRQYRHPQVYREPTPRQPAVRIFWRPSRKLVGGLGLLAGVAGLVWLVVASPVFAIETVKLTGEVTPPIATKLNELVGTNIFLVREDQAFRGAEAIDPALAGLRIIRGFPRQLQIEVIRRHPSLIWRSGDVSWAIDPAGIAFPLDPTTASGVPIVVDKRAAAVSAGQQILSPSFITFVQTGFERLPGTAGSPMIRAEIEETTFHVRFITEPGWQILMDSNRSFDSQLEHLRLVLSDHRDKLHDYIDLRVVGWAYVK